MSIGLQSGGNGVAIDGNSRIVTASISGVGDPGAVVRYQGGSAWCQ